MTPSGGLIIQGQPRIARGPALLGDVLLDHYRDRLAALRHHAGERLVTHVSEGVTFRAFDVIPPWFLGQGLLEVIVAATEPSTA